jgi:hypothetical protein
MNRRQCLIAIGGALPSLAIAAHGCKTATQVTLDLSTNVKCTDLRGVDIVVAEASDEAERRAALAAPGTRFPTATTTDCADGHIGTLVITPGGGDAAVVVIAAFGSTSVDACKAGSFSSQCIVARRRFSFIDHGQSTLPVLLDTDCAGVPCNVATTCVSHKCVDSNVDCQSGGVCSSPGKIGPDGGVIEEDGSPPFPPAPPPQDDGGPDAPNDSPNDAPNDVTTDAPGDGGTLFCANGAAGCGAIQCINPGEFCCYTMATGGCKSTSCPAMRGCCRDSNDCSGNNDFCCAIPSSIPPTAATTLTCQSLANCQAMGGAPVCTDSGGGTGCSGFAMPPYHCTANLYTNTTSPAFYFCGS